jgi:hypothetical protein
VGKNITIPNPRPFTTNVVQVRLDLPDSLASGQSFTSVFSVYNTDIPYWEVEILGWGSLDDEYNNRIVGRSSPVNLVHTAVWTPMPGKEWLWSTQVTASPSFRDDTTTKTFDFRSPTYPAFRIKFDPNGSAVLSAYIIWRTVSP